MPTTATSPTKSQLWAARGCRVVASGLWLMLLIVTVVSLGTSPTGRHQYAITVYLEWSILPAALSTVVAAGLWAGLPAPGRVEISGAAVLGLMYCLGWLFTALVIIPAWQSF